MAKAEAQAHGRLLDRVKRMLYAAGCSCCLVVLASCAAVKRGEAVTPLTSFTEITWSGEEMAGEAYVIFTPPYDGKDWRAVHP